MTDYLTEQEQIQQLKVWIKQYGPMVIAGILVATLITTGWRYWQNYRTKVLTHASGVYDEMLTFRAQNNQEDTLVQADKLLSHYSNTPYASMASLMLARDAANKREYTTAIQHLQWVMNHSHDRGLREIARTRLARILIADNKPEEAIKILKKLDDKNFIGLVDEIRGEAFLAQNNLIAARKSYQLALQELPNAEVTRPILEMKFDNLADEANIAS